MRPLAIKAAACASLFVCFAASVAATNSGTLLVVGVCGVREAPIAATVTAAFASALGGAVSCVEVRFFTVSGFGTFASALGGADSFTAGFASDSFGSVPPFTICFRATAFF